MSCTLITHYILSTIIVLISFNAIIAIEASDAEQQSHREPGGDGEVTLAAAARRRRQQTARVAT